MTQASKNALIQYDKDGKRLKHKALILKYIQHYGDAFNQQICTEFSIPMSTVSGRTAELTNDGIIYESGTTSSGKTIYKMTPPAQIETRRKRRTIQAAIHKLNGILTNKHLFSVDYHLTTMQELASLHEQHRDTTIELISLIENENNN